jgi:hypothetical protein
MHDDERAIRALALAYAHHADRREPELLAELFEPEGTLRMVWRTRAMAPAVSRGRKQIARVVRGMDRGTLGQGVVNGARPRPQGTRSATRPKRYGASVS